MRGRAAFGYRDADRTGDPHGVGPELEGDLECSYETSGKPLGIHHAAEASSDDDELVTAIADNGRVIAQLVLDPSCDGHHQIVAHFVPICVIHLLEPIEVAEQHRALMGAIARCALGS